MSPWRTMPGRDRIWLGLNTTILVSSAEPTSTQRLRALLADVAQADPECVLFRVADPTRPDRWRPAADVAEAQRVAADLPVVVVGSPDRESAARAVADLVETGTTGPTVRLFVAESGDGPGLVGLSIPHSWGDAMTVLGLARTLLSGPDPDGRLYTHVGEPRPKPLLAALRNRFGSLKALRTVPAARRAGVRDVPAGTPSGASAGGAARGAAGAVLGGGGTASAATALREDGTGAASGVVVMPVVLDRDAASTLKVWRRASGTGASTSSILMAGVRAALDAERVDLTDALVVAYDNRPYLPRGSSTRGNFASALRLRAADPHHPAEVHAVVHEANSAGRPLLALAAASARAALVRRPRWPSYPAPGGESDLSFAYVRIDRVLPTRLLAPTGGEAFVVVTTTPGAYGSVAVMVGDVSTEVHVTVTAHRSRIDEDAVRRALAAFAKDPVAWLPQVPADVAAPTEATTTA